VEGRLNLQLYRCDIESLLLESEGGSTSSSRFDSTSYEPESFDEILRQCGMISPEPGFLDLDSSSEEEGPEDNKLEGRVTPPLRLFDHLDSPTYEELLRQNWDLFEDSDQEPECSYTLKDVPKDLELLDSPGGNLLCVLRCCSLIKLFSCTFRRAGTDLLDRGYPSDGDASFS
jgi:hypothetical protein